MSLIKVTTLLQGNGHVSRRLENKLLSAHMIVCVCVCVCVSHVYIYIFINIYLYSIYILTVTVTARFSVDPARFLRLANPLMPRARK